MFRSMARGEGKAGCIVWLLIVAFVGLAAQRIVPAKVAAMQLEDYMEELAMMPATARQKPDFFVKKIVGRADELRLPVKKEDVTVKKTAKRVVMTVKYTLVVDLLVFEYPMNFDIHLDRQIFLT
ncbi:MAG: hypothetical protein MPN21_00500 [Thermoanaerobaculia bacterium]|nr:hypothetical protein [Thermoanaerobaculia bacterium]